MENKQIPKIQYNQPQSEILQDIAIEIPKKSKKWILIPIIFLFIAIISIAGAYIGTFHIPVLNQQKSEVLPEQKEEYLVNRPTKEEILQAFQKANNEVAGLNVPSDKIVDFIYPIFYPPNGYKYDNIQVTISEYPREEDRCKDDFCKKLQRDRQLRDGYKGIYVRLVGSYDNFQDNFLVGLKYSLLLNKGGMPSEITLNGFPQSISINLANKLDVKLENNTKVKSFKKKYSITSGIYSFYKSDIRRMNLKYPSQNSILAAGLSDNKEWIIVKYVESKFAIPELPPKSLTAYIDPTTYRVVKVK